VGISRDVDGMFWFDGLDAWRTVSDVNGAACTVIDIRQKRGIFVLIFAALRAPLLAAVFGFSGCSWRVAARYLAALCDGGTLRRLLIIQADDGMAPATVRRLINARMVAREKQTSLYWIWHRTAIPRRALPGALLSGVVSEPGGASKRRRKE